MIMINRLSHKSIFKPKKAVVFYSLWYRRGSNFNHEAHAATLIPDSKVHGASIGPI